MPRFGGAFRLTGIAMWRRRAGHAVFGAFDPPVNDCVRAIRASGPCDENGVASFDLIRHHRANESIFLYAFDLIELNGDDMRRDPLEVRKATLASIVAKAGPGIRFNEHIEGDGPTVSPMPARMGLEGIVSKRLGSRYRSGRSTDWLKFKTRLLRR